MPRVVMGLALASALLWFWAAPSVAQQGVYIENNGVDSSNNAAGADNVRISRNPGNSASNNGAGANNEERHAVQKEKARKDRSDRNGGGEAAPVAEDAAAPAGDDFQAYAEPTGYDDGTGYAEPAAAPQDLPPVDPSEIVKLPSTGVGVLGAVPLAALASALAAMALGWGIRRRLSLR
jgi:hypothetical protein